MSDFGEEIINRLPLHSPLHDKSHPMYKIIDKTIGEWLQRMHDNEWFSQFFLDSATGKYLDLHGRDFGVLRKPDESDDDYRKRIIYESMGHLTVNYLMDVYDVELYAYVNNYNPSNNTLTSDNPYISKDGYIGVADTTVKDILNKKFILGSDVTWL